MKTFIVRFGGVVLGGKFLIIDETKEQAFNQAKKELEIMGLTKHNLGTWFSVDNPECIEEVDCTTKHVILIDDGDY